MTVEIVQKERRKIIQEEKATNRPKIERNFASSRPMQRTMSGYSSIAMILSYRTEDNYSNEIIILSITSTNFIFQVRGTSFLLP